MVVIRLARGGSKGKPFYRIEVKDKSKPRDGRFIEKVGFFNPSASGQAERLQMKRERIDYWVSKGAQMSDRVKTLLKEFAKQPNTATIA